LKIFVAAKHTTDENNICSKVRATGYGKLISFEDNTHCASRKTKHLTTLEKY
jgi:hypothetical protein